MVHISQQVWDDAYNKNLIQKLFWNIPHLHLRAMGPRCKVLPPKQALFKPHGHNFSLHVSFGVLTDVSHLCYKPVMLVHLSCMLYTDSTTKRRLRRSHTMIEFSHNQQSHPRRDRKSIFVIASKMTVSVVSARAGENRGSKMSHFLVHRHELLASNQVSVMDEDVDGALDNVDRDRDRARSTSFSISTRTGPNASSSLRY